MNITSVLRFTYWNSTNSGVQYHPKHSSNTFSTRGEKFGKELSWKQTLSRWTKIDASEFSNLVTTPKTADGQLKFIGGDQVWELQPWQGTIQVRGEVQEDLLGESDGFPPTTKAGGHCTSTQSIQRSAISSPKLIRKVFNKQTYAVYYRQVALMVPGLSTMSSLSSLHQIQHQSNVRVRIDKHWETRTVSQPIREQKLRIHDKYGETRM